MVKYEANKKLVIIAGVNGAIGKAFHRHYKQEDRTTVLGLSRGEDFKSVDLSEITDVVYIHAIGKFKFEPQGVAAIDKDGDGIDDEVYESNVTTLKLAIKYLVTLLGLNNHVQNVAVIAFGSTSDPYKIPYWQSYSRATSKMKEILQNSLGLDSRLKAVFMNLSSVDTAKERALRPLANTDLWLDPSDVVVETLAAIDHSTDSWHEESVYKKISGYGSKYYKDKKRILKEWKEAIG